MQGYPTEISMIMQMFYVCTIQQGGSHEPHVTI